MDEVDKLIESYYAVSQHIQREGERLLDIANMLGKAADQMSDQRMREKQPVSASEGQI